MKLFLDTAIVRDIEPWIRRGVIDGVTTNPTLLARAGGDPVAAIHEILQCVPHGLISVEVTETDPEAMYVQAQRIAHLSPQILVKIPCALPYYEKIRTLVAQGVRLNITLVFSLTQALLMSKLGVEYISPFIGRLEDAHYNSMLFLHSICESKRKYGFKTQILAASVRSQEHVSMALHAGVDAITISPHLLEECAHHSLTEAGIETFMQDWKKLGVKQFP